MIYTDFIMIWSARSSEYQWIQWSSCWSCRTSAFFQELRFRTWDARLNDFSAKRNVDRWTDFFWRPPGTDFWYSESWWKSMDMGYFFIFFQGIWGDYTYISYIYILNSWVIFVRVDIYTLPNSDFVFRFSEELERNTMTKAAAGRFCHLLSRKAVGKPLWHVTCEENAEALRIVRQELAQVKKETWNKKTRRKQLRG